VIREEKEKLAKELAEAFENSNSFYLLDFIKMPVSQIVELRKLFREHSYSFKVVKNRLALRALKEGVPEDLRKYFQGPTAIAFSSDDPIGLARVIKGYSEKHKILRVKAGILQGQFFPPERFSEVATLSSRQELIAKLGNLMAWPLMRFMRTWQAPINNIGRLLSQLKTKK
jgi:large subunit ribosomal protein L10